MAHCRRMLRARIRQSGSGSQTHEVCSSGESREMEKARGSWNRKGGVGAMQVAGQVTK